MGFGLAGGWVLGFWPARRVWFFWRCLAVVVVCSGVGLLAFPRFVRGLFGLVFWSFLELLVVY